MSRKFTTENILPLNNDLMMETWNDVLSCSETYTACDVDYFGIYFQPTLIFSSFKLPTCFYLTKYF